MINSHDAQAEQALLGAVLSGSTEAEPHFRAVPIEAYYQHKHQVLAAAIGDMLTRGRSVDPITVMGELLDAGAVAKAGGQAYLHSLMSMPWKALFAGDYASRIVELYGRRKFGQQCQKTMQRLDADPWEGEESLELAAAIGEMRATLDEVTGYADTATIAEPPSLDELLAQRDEHDWLVPGLLERGDRLILTGEEGFGKSELVSQLALCAAGSIHPFLGDLLSTECRVLVVDCENSPSQNRRRWRRIAGAVESTRAMHEADSVDWAKRFRVEHRTSGLDLTQPRDALWLESLVASVSPDILVVGPLYKLHLTNINDGEAARKILDSLDRIRERHRVCIITEAHPGKAEHANGGRKMAPEGSSLFMRWPEFGLGLRRNKDDPHGQADVVSWRGQREERGWPSGLVRGHSGLLPWRPTPEYYDQPTEH